MHYYWLKLVTWLVSTNQSALLQHSVTTMPHWNLFTASGPGRSLKLLTPSCRSKRFSSKREVQNFLESYFYEKLFCNILRCPKLVLLKDSAACDGWWHQLRRTSKAKKLSVWFFVQLVHGEIFYEGGYGDSRHDSLNWEIRELVNKLFSLNGIK